MIFQTDLIRDCFPTWVHLRILETLMRKPQAMSQRRLASIMGIPRATAHRALQDLGKTGLIRPHRVGSATYWEFDRQGYLYETLLPILDGLNAITPPLAYLKNLVRQALALPKGYRCILFGSIVSGNDTPSSDIDLCIILPAKRKGIPIPLQGELESLQDLCREKFGKRLNTLCINQDDLSQHPERDLYRNILKGLEIQ